MVAMVVETEEYISLTEAAEILSVDRTSLWRQCRAGKISCREVPCKNSPSGKTYEIPKKYVFQKGLNIEEKKSEEPIDIQKKIDALNLPPIEAERLKATLGSFSKAEAEKVLKAEQALAKTKDNVLRDGFYIERSKVAEQVGYVFSNFSHSLKDLITIWQKRYGLEENQAYCMMMDLEKSFKTAIEAMRDDRSMDFGRNREGIRPS